MSKQLARHRRKKGWRCEAENLPITEIAYQARLQTDGDSPHSLSAHLDDGGIGLEVVWTTSWAFIIYVFMILFGSALILTSLCLAVAFYLWHQ